VHGLHAVLEGGLDGLHTFFDALSLLWDLTQSGYDLSWHREVVDLGGPWLATFGVVLVDQGLDELEELGEISLELPEFRTDWVCLLLADAGVGIYSCLSKIV